MNVDKAIEKSIELLGGIYKNDSPSYEAIANLTSNILVAQAIEKLAEAMSDKGPRIVPLVDPKNRRMDS